MNARTSNRMRVQPTTTCRPPPTSHTSQPPPAANSDHQPHLTPDEQQGRETKKKGGLGYPFFVEVCFSPLACFYPPNTRMRSHTCVRLIFIFIFIFIAF